MRSRGLPWLLAVPLAVACGGGNDQKDPAAKPTTHDATKAGDAPEPTAPPTAATGTGAAAVDATGGGTAEPATEGPPEPAAHPGPCKITWSDGTVLRLKYTDSGGSVTIDHDGDGKRDLCGRFRRSDDRTTSVSVDLECDKKTDLTIRPKYEKDANLAEATYTITTDGEKTRRAVTLVTMPSFSGLDPGFPLPAKRKDIELSIREGTVRRARIEEPNDGRPELVVEFVYDDQGRIEGIREDERGDGSVDRRFDYRYDEHGNVTRVSAVAGENKRTARIDYSCWK